MNNEEIIKQFGEHSNALRLHKIKTMPIIAAGNVIDGFVFYGPFESDQASIEWATDKCSVEWVAADLHHPDQKG